MGDVVNHQTTIAPQNYNGLLGISQDHDLTPKYIVSLYLTPKYIVSLYLTPKYIVSLNQDNGKEENARSGRKGKLERYMIETVKG